MPRAKTAKPKPAAGNSPSALEYFALAVAGKRNCGKKRRAELAVGNGQAVDVTLRIRGAIDVQEGTTAVTSKAPAALDLLAVMLHLLPANMRAKMTDAMRKAFAKRAALELQPGVLTLAEKLLGDVSEEKTSHRAGAVSGSISVERIG